MNIALNGSQTIALGPFNVNGVPQAGNAVTNFTIEVDGAAIVAANAIPSVVGADGYISYTLSGTDTSTAGDVVVSATAAGITLARAAWIGGSSEALGETINLGPFIANGAPQAGVVPTLAMRANGASQVPAGTAAATDSYGFSAYEFASGDAPTNGDLVISGVVNGVSAERQFQIVGGSIGGGGGGVSISALKAAAPFWLNELPVENSGLALPGGIIG